MDTNERSPIVAVVALFASNISGSRSARRVFQLSTLNFQLRGVAALELNPVNHTDPRGGDGQRAALAVAKAKGSQSGRPLGGGNHKSADRWRTTEDGGRDRKR